MRRSEPSESTDVAERTPDPRSRWRSCLFHLLAAAFLALVFQVVLLDEDFTESTIQCHPPISYVGDPRPIADQSSAMFDDTPHCWDAAQRHVRASTALLGLMAAAWLGYTVAKWRSLPANVFGGVFALLGVVALVGDFFWLFS